MGNNNSRILKKISYLTNTKNFIPRTKKAKKCKKCTYYDLNNGCGISSFKILTFQTNIKKCKQFREIKKSITGDY